MITRIEITYRSKEPTDKGFKVFSPHGYRVIKNGVDFTFDFENSEWSSRHEDGYLYIDVLQKYYDNDAGLPQEQVDSLMRELAKEDFVEIHAECYEDDGETLSIELIPTDIVFYDCSESGDGKPIEVKGNEFMNLLQ
jgi:hypothetical protein